MLPLRSWPCWTSDHADSDRSGQVQGIAARRPGGGRGGGWAVGRSVGRDAADHDAGGRRRRRDRGCGGGRRVPPGPGRRVPAHPPQRVRTSYARRGDLALIELATVCGLERLPGGQLAPMDASSYGVGEVMRAALADGANELVLAVGGSAST